MAEFERRSPMPASAAAVYAWHARDGALVRLLPPFDRAEVLASSGDFAHRRVVVRVPILGPIHQKLVAQHGDVVPGRRFRDTQLHGPFARWEHSHLFDPAPPDPTPPDPTPPDPAGPDPAAPDVPERSVLVDHVEYTLPFGLLGRIFGTPLLTARLQRMFEFRHQRTREDLERHAGTTPLRVAVSGASGLIGTQLCAFLGTGGHTVYRLVRREARDGEIAWDPARGTVDSAALEGVDAVVHLAGENVAGGRWTPAMKARILQSRVQGTRTIATALAALQRPPKVLLSTSAVGYYGHTGDTVVDESAPSGEGFLAEVCRAWEAAAEPARAAGIRVVHPRIGVVLSGAGGALAQMKTPFLFGVGGPVGGGRQGFPWIAMDDVVGAFHHLLRSPLAGPVNLVAPAPISQGPISQGDFAHVLGKVLGRPSFLPTPAFAVRALFGEMGQRVLLDGQRVVPKRLLEDGYHFLRPDLEAALRFELGK